MRFLVAVCLASLATAAPAVAAPAFRLSSQLVMPGKSPSWDHLTFEPGRGYLFVGRRKDGVTVIDTRTNRVVGAIANSADANIALLIPELDRGFTANEDGSTTVFQLSSLRTIERVHLGEAADAAFYDPVTQQVVFTFGDTKELIYLDPRTNRAVAHVAMPSEELEAVAMGGNGTLWVNERDVNKVAHVDNRTHRLIAEYDLPGCTMPSGLDIDAANKRLFVGCKSDKPVLAVVDSGSGRVVTTLEIGRGNDGVVYDAANHRILTSNGVEGNVVIIDQVNADTYKFAGAFTTRPLARTLAYDPATHRLFTMTAEGMVDPAKARNLRAGSFYPNGYFDDSFVLLTYKEQ